MAQPVTDPVFLLAFYAAVVVAMGPDVLREIRRRRADDADAVTRDAGSRRAIGAASTGGILAGVAAASLVPSAAIPWRPRLVFVTGIGVLLLGGGVRQYAVRTLDEYFTTAVEIRDDQQVVDTGPYRWVRHPSYTGGLLQFLGIGLVLGNWISLVATTVPLVVAYVYRIRIEERTLAEELGEPYRRFLNRTPYRLVPYVW